MRLPVRVAAIILKEDEVLLIHRIKSGAEYWVFPGGGLEDTDSSYETALLREIEEETQVNVLIKRHVYTHEYENSKGVYYLCDFVSGIPRLRTDSEEKLQMLTNNGDLYEPVWLPAPSLNDYMVYPLEIRDLLLKDFPDKFPKVPLVTKLNAFDLRTK